MTTICRSQALKKGSPFHSKEESEENTENYAYDENDDSDNFIESEGLYHIDFTFIVIYDPNEPKVYTLITFDLVCTKLIQIHNDYLIGIDDNLFVVFGLKEQRVVQYLTDEDPSRKNCKIIEVNANFILLYNNKKIFLCSI